MSRPSLPPTLAATRRRARGFAMPWALAMLVLVGGVSAAVVSRMAALRQSTLADEADLAAVLAADGAIATARVELAADAAWVGACVPVGRIDVCTTAARERDGWIVTARSGGGVVIEAHLRPDGDHVPRVVSWRRVR